MRARGDQYKSQEHEGPDQRLSIITILLEADNHLAAAKLLLSMFQHRNKAFFGSLWKNVTRDLNEKRLSEQQGFPLHFLTDESHIEAEVRHAAVACCKAAACTTNASNLQTFDTDRGLFYIPHTVALCLTTRYIVGVGDIRSTAEALGPVVY